MPLIGVRELRSHTSEVLRRVREEKAEYVITHQGTPIALILPVDTEAIEAKIIAAAKQTTNGSWDTYHQLAERLRRDWPDGQDTQSLIDEIRQG